MKTSLIIAVIHNFSSCEIKAWKNPGLNGIRTHALCDTGAVLYQTELSRQLKAGHVIIYPKICIEYSVVDSE